MSSPFSHILAFALGWVASFAVAWAHHELRSRFNNGGL